MRVCRLLKLAKHHKGRSLGDALSLAEQYQHKSRTRRTYTYSYTILTQHNTLLDYTCPSILFYNLYA